MIKFDAIRIEKKGNGAKIFIGHQDEQGNKIILGEGEFSFKSLEKLMVNIYKIYENIQKEK